MWLDRQDYSLADLHDASFAMIRAVIDRCEAIISALDGLGTRSSLIDELHRSVRTLSGVPFEILRNSPRHLQELRVFFPSNNLLYSYTLFALIPSLYADKIVIRPSARVKDATVALHDLFADLTDGRVQAVDTSQRDFLAQARSADAVIFTGQAENAAKVRRALAGGPTLLTFGSGPTPFVIGPEADVPRATRELVNARLFNSGQDCLCPDVIFVHSDVLPAVVGELRVLLLEQATQNSGSKTASVVPIIYADAVEEATAFVRERWDRVLYGGQFRPEEGLIPPTVVALEFDESFRPPEFFSPIFCLMSYTSADQLVEWFESPEQQRRGMYATVHGEYKLRTGMVGTTVILDGRSPLDVEDGNLPFGGYGMEAGCLQVGSTATAQPLLLSAAVSRVVERRDQR